MSQLLKIQALFISSALLMFGGGLHGLLLSVRGAEEGFSTLALGLIGTGWSVGFVAGSIMVPAMVQRVGHIRAYSVMAAIGAITMLLNLLWINDIGWIVMRVFSGFCFSGAAMIVESWLNEEVDNANRGTIFSTYVMINMSASTVGQLAMSVTGVSGYLPFVLGAISLIAALTPTALTTNPQPRPMAARKLDWPLLYRTSPVAVITSFGVGMANGTYGTLVPVFAYQKGIDTANIAYLVSVPVIVGALAQIPLGRLSDLMDRRLIIIFGAALAAVVGLVMVLTNPNGLMLYIMFGLYGLSAFPIYAVAVAHANDFAKAGDFSTIAAGMLLTLGVGLAIGPFIAPFIMNVVGPAGLFVITAIMHAVIAIAAILRMMIRPLPNDQVRRRFRPLPFGKNSTPSTAVLDPRSEPPADPASSSKA